MARRFGRNQRRALREQIRDLGAELDQMVGIANDLRDEVGKQSAKYNRFHYEVQQWGARILRHTREDSIFSRTLLEIGIDEPMARYLREGNPMNRAPALQNYRHYIQPEQLTVEVVRAFATYLEARNEIYPHPGVLFLCKTPD